VALPLRRSNKPSTREKLSFVKSISNKAAQALAREALASISALMLLEDSYDCIISIV
jgi:hypothetical protein